MTWKTFKYFIDVVIPGLLLPVGTFTNLLIMLVYSRARFSKLPTRNVWRMLALVDVLCLMQLAKYFVLHAFDYNVYLVSSLCCQLLGYLSHIGIISAWLHVYISIERVLSVICSSVCKRLHHMQPAVCFFIVAFYLAFYSHRFILTDLDFSNVTNSVNCSTSALHLYTDSVLKWVDTLVSTIVPFCLMFTCSAFLAWSVLRSRNRLQLGKQLNSKRLHRDIKFSATLIALNVIFLVCKLPAIVFLSAGGDKLSLCFSILDDLYYFNFVANFFVYLWANSLFFDEFTRMLRIRHLFKRSKDYK